MDTILYNGKLTTMNPQQPQAQALALKDGLIQAVGSDQEILALKQPGTRLIDLAGRMVLPGFNDAHMHLAIFGAKLQECDLYNSGSEAEVIERGRRFLAEKGLPAGQWLIGKGWHQDYFASKTMLSRHDLDQISTEHPICFMNAGFHSLAVNTKALQVAAIDATTPQVEGGQFTLEADGYPTGLFLESAMDLIYDILPKQGVHELKAMIREACTYANRQGITSIQTDDFIMAGVDYHDVLQAYRELIAEDAIHVRIYEQCNLPEQEQLTQFLAEGYRTGQGDDRFQIGPYKILADGNIGGQTAYMCQPYNGTDKCGFPIHEPAELDVLVELAHSNGMQIAVHVIGDKASYITLDAFAKALDKNPRADHRHTMIHCQILDQTLLERYREMQVIGSAQPIFLHYDAHVVEERLGVERVRTSYNWRTMLDMGIALAFGSDCPVEPMDVLPGIHCAVNRQDLQLWPEGGWYPEEKLTIDEAIHGFTLGAAYGQFAEAKKGSLTAGKLADIVVLAENLYEVTPDHIKDVKVDLTIMDGKIVYER